jgi:hypothetical protein
VDSCPASGKILRFGAPFCTIEVMSDPEVVSHITASTGLSPADAARVVDDVVAFYAEPAEDFVRRRHAELKERGMRNSDIFRLVMSELSERVVSAPELSERQLRRIVYG